MNFHIDCWIDMFKYNGRASRKEIAHFLLLKWFFTIGLVWISVLLEHPQNAPYMDMINAVPAIYGVLCLLPMFAVVVRRLHDLNLTGWFCFLLIVPLVNVVFVLFLLSSKEVEEHNSYGISSKNRYDNWVHLP